VRSLQENSPLHAKYQAVHLSNHSDRRRSYRWRKQKANHAPPRHARRRRAIRRNRNSDIRRIMRIIRIKRLYRRIGAQGTPRQPQTDALGSGSRVDDDDGQTPIRVQEGAALEIVSATGSDPDGARPNDAELGERPKTFGDDVVLTIHQNQLFVVVVIGRPVLDAFPEDVGAEIGVDDAVEHGVGPRKPVSRTPVRIPGGAPAPVKVGIFRLPDAARRAHGSADSRCVFVGCDGVHHILCSSGRDLGSVLRRDGPAGRFTAIDAYIRHVVTIERRAEYFDKFSRLGAGGLHRGVRGGVVRFVQETEVSNLDAGGGIVLGPFYEIVGVGLFPVTAGAAVGS
jgi:hypothetical protein